MVFDEDSDGGTALEGHVTKERIVKQLNLDDGEADHRRNLPDEEVDEEEEEEEEEREDELDGAQLAEEQDDDNPLDEPGDFVEGPPDEPSNGSGSDVRGYYEDEPSADETVGRPINVGREEDPWFPQGAEDSLQRGEGIGHPAFARKGVQAAREKTRMRREQAPPAIRETLKARVAANQHKKAPFFLRKRVQDGFDARQVPNEGATSTMKAHDPNTQEFRERRGKILAQIEKKKGKKARVEVEKHMNDVLNKRVPIPDSQTKKAKRPFTKVIERPKLRERIPIVKRMVKMNNEESLMLDTTLAFIDGLAQGLFRTDASLTVKEQRALNDWLQLLSIALPQEWGLHELIDVLMAKKSFVSQRRQNMLQVLENHGPKRRLYSPSCRATKIPFNCGFWKLLHTVCEYFCSSCLLRLSYFFVSIKPLITLFCVRLLPPQPSALRSTEVVSASLKRGH